MRGPEPRKRREREERHGGKVGQGKKGDIRIAAKGWGPRAFVVAKRTLVGGGARRSEREAQGRRGAARALQLRAHATHAYSAHARGTRTALHNTGVCTEAHARAAA